MELRECGIAHLHCVLGRLGDGIAFLDRDVAFQDHCAAIPDRCVALLGRRLVLLDHSTPMPRRCDPPLLTVARGAGFPDPY